MGRKSNSETLTPEIKTIRLNNLENFMQSEIFQNYSVVPLTPSRAKSYVNNPHGKPEDVVLFLAIIEQKLVAFRSLFAGTIRTGKVKIRFAWCSGNWVHPDFRGKGLSTLLLNEAYSAWNGKLMFTNYAPESEKLYLKTGWFKPIHQFEGVRAYLFPKTVKLLPFVRKNKWTTEVFKFIDFCIAGFTKLKILFFKYTENKDTRFEVSEFPDEESYRFVEKYKADFLFERGKEELKWIFQNPWISIRNSKVAGKYPFSAFTNSFSYQTVKVWQNNELSGVFIFSVREGHLKTLFFWLDPGLEYKTARFLKYYCIQHKLEMATVYNLKITRQLFAQKFPFLHMKKFGQNIYSSFDIHKTEKFQFQDGDGDVVFT
jgi:GNAT superfamily N-acetyltransferase